MKHDPEPTRTDEKPVSSQPLRKEKKMTHRHTALTVFAIIALAGAISTDGHAESREPSFDGLAGEGLPDSDSGTPPPPGPGPTPVPVPPPPSPVPVPMPVPPTPPAPTPVPAPPPSPVPVPTPPPVPPDPRVLDVTVLPAHLYPDA